MGFTKKDLVRINKSTMNTTAALTTSIVMGVVSFIERMVFNSFFIADYLGLYSFFYSTISVLSASELGISIAIAYALYLPIEENNEGQIWAIMHLFKKAYIIIGTLILTGGIILLPFLKYLINTTIPIEEVMAYFLLYVLSTVVNYWLSYRSILVSANQEEYKITLITNTCWTILYIVQMAITIITKNFLYYAAANLVANTVRGILITALTRREYPFLSKRMDAKLDKTSRRKIVMNVKGLISTRLGAIIVNSTDSILTSAMVGTAFLGLYSNYIMITTGLNQITKILPNAVTASIGNIGVSETKRKIARSFETLNLSSFFIYGPLTIVMINITNPIINVFFANRVIPMTSVVIIYLNFYLTNFRQLLQTYKSSLGLYYYDRKRPVIEGLTNLVLSIVMGYFWGFNGIIGATAITNLAINLWIEPLIIYHEGLARSSIWFYITALLRFALTAALTGATYYVNSNIPLQGIWLILARLGVCIIMIIPVFFLIYRKNETARTVFDTLKVAVMKKRTSEE